MKKHFLFAFAAASLLGTAAHFFYDWLPFPLVGLFAPINESVWEHLKLLFWPTILSGFWLAGKTADKHRLWSALLASSCVMPLLLLGTYYTLYCGFGVDSDIVNILLYYLTMAVGFFLAARWFTRRNWGAYLGYFLMAAGIYAVALTVFSISAPALPIFISKIP